MNVFSRNSRKDVFGSDEFDDEPSELAKEYRDTIYKAINSVESSGDFCFGGALPSAPNPGIEVKPLGIIGLPISNSQAEDLKKLCEQSPYGKKDQTILDKNVRNSLQLSPSQFSILNPGWNKFLEQLTESVATGLGVMKSKISLHIYKLLLYETGGFFKIHRDTEKEQGILEVLLFSFHRTTMEEN